MSLLSRIVPSIALGSCLVAGMAGATASGRSLPEGDYTAPVAVETATFIGSPGSEYLAAGAFLPDGRIMLAGVCQDPEITLHGVRAKVIGKDGEAFPVQDDWKALGTVDTGKIAQPKIKSLSEDDFGDLDLGDLGGALMTDEEIAQ